MTVKQLHTIKEMCLMLAMFFLPFGYDALFKFIMDITGSYWAADIIFYCTSGLFFISYFLLKRFLNKQVVDNFNN